jgi:hypothetical protein
LAHEVKLQAEVAAAREIQRVKEVSHLIFQRKPSAIYMYARI